MQRAESCVQLPVPLVTIRSHPARERGCKEHGPGSVGFVFVLSFPIPVASRYSFLQLKSQKQIVTLISAFPLY